MQMAAKMANKIIILKPLLIQAVIIWAAKMDVAEPKLFVNPIPMILTCVGKS